MNDDTLVYFGDAVKALGSGKVGGYLVRFGTADSPDCQGDYFDAKTAFGVHIPGKIDAYYHHGLRRASDPYTAEFGNEPIGVTDVKALPDGLYAETTLDIARPAVARLYSEFERGRYLGYSSGSDERLTRYESVKANVRRVARWPINDATLSPVPVDRRNRAYALKALMDDHDGPDPEPDNDATCPKCGHKYKSKKAAKALDTQDIDPDAVAAKGLVDRSARLVADATELAGLFAKARDQRVAEGRDLSPDKRAAIKALSDRLAELADAAKGKLDPAKIRAARASIARVGL